MIARIQALLHMPAWNDAVLAARSTLHLARGISSVDDELHDLGWQRLEEQLWQSWMTCVQTTGLSERYAPYFAGCVLSHFDAESVHRAPRGLISRLEARVSRLRGPHAGIQRLSFIYRESIDSEETSRGAIPSGVQVSPLHDIRQDHNDWRWMCTPLPYGIEIDWPYQVPMLCLDPEDAATLKTELRAEGINMTWIWMDHFVAFQSGQWCVLPVRQVQLSQAMTLNQIFGLPETTEIGVLRAPVPMLIDGLGAIHQIQFEPVPTTRPRYPFDFRSLGDLHPIAPRVHRDLTMPPDEETSYQAWRRLATVVATHPAFHEWRGAPRKTVPSPSPQVYSELVQQCYIRKLRDWGHQQQERLVELAEADQNIGDPSQNDRHTMWASAKRQVRKQIPESQRDRIPDGERARIDATTPWKSGFEMP